MKTIIIFIRSPCKHSNQGLQPLTVNHFQDYYFNCKPKSGLSIFAVNLYQDETLFLQKIFVLHLPHICIALKNVTLFKKCDILITICLSKSKAPMLHF